MDIKKEEEKVQNRLKLQPFLSIVVCFSGDCEEKRRVKHNRFCFLHLLCINFMYLNSFIIHIPGILIFVGSSFVPCNATYVSNCR